MTIKIPTDTVKKEFNNFLNMEENSRVLFSGKFGIGKTHFLNDFFEEQKELYEVFHLYPVNYQINTNDDIVDLLKYDIIVELLKKNKDIFDGKLVEGIKESSLLFWSWLKEKYTTNDLLQKIISGGENLASFSPDPINHALAKLGKPLKDILEIDKEFQGFKKEYKAGDKGLIEKYTNEVRIKNISEPDYISFLVKEKIIQQKGSRKSILVLDDLDRVDPEHTFRLLNLLSAFFEREDQNRFGFDVIIVVADYSNLKHIFHHKYGVETDFSGYVNKFFTIAPYYFDNKKAIINSIEEIVKSLKNENPELKDAIAESGYIKLFLEHVFVRAVETDTVNLRELLKGTRFQFLELKKDNSYGLLSRRDFFQQIFDIGIRIAILSFSHINIFLNVIREMKKAPKKTQERMPFKLYITSMIKSLELNETNSKSFYLGEYLITWDTQANSFSEVAKIKEEDLFYELLITYVENKKHLGA